jgi:hypothetical protein
MEKTDGTERSTAISVWYCEECKALCLTYIAKQTVRGEAKLVMNKNGGESEYKFDPGTTRNDEYKCPDCETELIHKVEVPQNLYAKIWEKLNEKDDTTFEVDLTTEDGMDVSDLSPQEVYDQIFEALL